MIDIDILQTFCFNKNYVWKFSLAGFFVFKRRSKKWVQAHPLGISFEKLVNKSKGMVRGGGVTKGGGGWWVHVKHAGTDVILWVSFILWTKHS